MEASSERSVGRLAAVTPTEGTGACDRSSVRALRILVALEEGQVPPWLARGVPSSFDLERQPSIAAATEWLTTREVDVIIGRWGARWSKWLTTHAPAPSFFHIGQAESSLLAAASRGLSVCACPDLTALESAFAVVLGQERRSPRISPVGGTRAMVDGSPLGVLHDFSNTGLSLLAPVGTPLTGLVCDRVLTVEVQVHGSSALGPCRARVTRVDASERGYLIALTFVDEQRPPLVAERQITDPTRIEALLKSALERGGLSLESHEPPCSSFRPRGGAILAAARTILLEGAPPLDPLSLVDVEFEVAGVQFSCTSVVVSSAPLGVRMPRKLEARERRSTERRQSPDGAVLSFHHPLLEREVSVRVVDLSPDGLGLELRDSIALPMGLRLDGARLSCGGTSLPMRASVKRLTRLDEGVWRCGVSVSFLGGAQAEAGSASLWLRAEFPELEPGSQASPAELMSLFARTGTAPPGVALAQGTRALELLHRAPPDLYRSLVLRRNGSVVAHVSAIRRYRSLWTVQHLTSTHPDRRAPFSLLRAGIEVSRLEGTAEFVHGTYAVSNAWSSRTMGSGLSGVDGAGRWALPLRQLSLFSASPTLEAVSGVMVRPPESEAEALHGEAIIAELEPALLMQAYEWQASQWSLSGFSERWRQAGLERTRTALLAFIGSRVAAVALLECSTPGLNLREDLSAARVWLAPWLPSLERRAVLSSTVVAIGRWYGEVGRDVWPLITTPNEEDAWLDAQALAAPVPFVEATTRMDAVHSLSRIWAEMAGERRERPTPTAATSGPEEGTARTSLA